MNKYDTIHIGFSDLANDLYSLMEKGRNALYYKGVKITFNPISFSVSNVVWNKDFLLLPYEINNGSCLVLEEIAKDIETFIDKYHKALANFSNNIKKLLFSEIKSFKYLDYEISYDWETKNFIVKFQDTIQEFPKKSFETDNWFYLDPMVEHIFNWIEKNYNESDIWGFSYDKY